MEGNPKNELSEEAKELKKFLERPYDPNERWHDTIGMSVGNLTLDEIREIRRQKREWLDKLREERKRKADENDSSSNLSEKED